MSRGRRRRPDASGRDEGGRYMTLDYAMVQSRAWRTLGGAAVRIWIELRSRYDGSNNGSLRLSCREAARLLDTSRNTVWRGFCDLRERGFIKLRRQGWWRTRTTHEWEITALPTGDKGNRTLATRDWNCWKPTPAASGQKSELGPARGPPMVADGPARGTTSA